MEYVAIDFQTANKWHKSACSVALVTVKDGKIIDTFYSLIRPGILHFDKENTALHGITKEMVKDAPCFARACFRKQCSRRCLNIACRTLPKK